MNRKALLIIGPALILALGVFQNCAGGNNISPLDQSSSAPTIPPPPTINGVSMTLPPCTGNPNPIVISTEYSSGAPLAISDQGVIWAASKFTATSSSGTGVYAERMTLTNLQSSSEPFFPGASFSPQSGASFIGSSAIAVVPAGTYSLQIGGETVSSVTSHQVTGAYYPLCGSSTVIASYKTDSATAASPILPLSLDESAHVFVAAEKTVSNAPTFLTITLHVLNTDTNQTIACPLQGTTAWHYQGNSTPSVSGFCEVDLPPGHYAIFNVVSSDAADLTGTQHLGFLAVRQTAGEIYSSF